MPIRRLLAATAGCLLLTACTSWVATVACADPPLVLSSSDTLTGASDWLLRHPDGGAEDIAPDPAAHEPVLSPDGRTIAFALGEGPFSDSFGWEKSRAAVLSLESRDVSVLSADLTGATVRGLQWSADGSEIAFSRSSLEGDEIVAVRVDDGRERRLLELTSGQGWSYSWSPDGKELLVPTVPDTPPSAVESVGELRRYSVATGDHGVVPAPHETIWDVAWSPDGRLVAMAADTPGTGRIRLHVLDLETGDSHPVDRRRGGPTSISWSGPYLFYSYYAWAGEDAVVLMRWDGRTQERASLFDLPELVSDGGWEATVSAPSCGGQGWVAEAHPNG